MSNHSAMCYMLSCFSCVRLFATPWTVACQAPLSMGILQARILEWVASSPPPGDLPNPGIEPMSLVSCNDRPFFITREAPHGFCAMLICKNHWKNYIICFICLSGWSKQSLHAFRMSNIYDLSMRKFWFSFYCTCQCWDVKLAFRPGKNWLMMTKMSSLRYRITLLP